MRYARHTVWTLVLTALVAAGCATPRPRPPVPPQPVPAVPLTMTVTDAAGPLVGAAAACGEAVTWSPRDDGGQPGTSDGFGRIFGTATAGRQIDCTFSFSGYVSSTASWLPGWKEGQDRGELARVVLVAAIPEATDPVMALHVEGNKRWFARADGQRFDWREVSGFALLGQAIYEGLPAAERWIEAWQAIGANGARVAASYTLYPGGQVDPEHTPGYWEAVRALTRAAGRRGFYIRWTTWMASEPWGGVWYPDRRDIWTGSVRAGGEAFGRRFAAFTKDEPNVLSELANEPGEIGMKDSFDELTAFAREVKAIAPDRLLDGGSPHHEGDQQFTAPPFDFSDSHNARDYFEHESWPSHKRSTDHPLINPAVQAHPMPFTNGEPTNWGPAPGRGDYDRSPASAFCAGAVARVTASYATFHYDGGVTGQLPSEEVATLARAYFRGLDAIPMVDRYDVWRGHHAVSPVRGAPFAPDDGEDVVVPHVRRGNLWRVVGTGPYLVGLMEHKDFNLSRYATRPITTIGREVWGDFACGVYRQQ